MLSTSNLYCRQIIGIIAAHGVKTAYCCPGSRNAPLLIAINAEDDFDARVVVDERSAAFQALGCSMIEKKPVLIVCTSGSALLNFAPAVAEAYYAGIPLVVVSADRPREWIDQDDSQTIRQYNILSHIVKGSYDIRAIPEGREREFSPDVQWTINRTVNEAMVKAAEGKPGPVHINVQLSDPLGQLSDCHDLPQRIVSQIKAKDIIGQHVIKQMADKASDARILLVAGFGAPDHNLDKAVKKFASLPNVAVMAETISNLHDPQPLASMIDSVLCEMSREERDKLRPDIVISFGGSLISRMLKQYLRSFPTIQHWSLGHSNYFCDCFQSLTQILDVSPEMFLRQLYGAMKKVATIRHPDYSTRWKELRERALRISEKFIASSSWSDLTALDYILRNMPLDNLFLSNGTSVRYSQLIPHRCHAEYCNRGVSGIDGSTATAVGAANSYTGQTTLITGDMSFIYDSGASTLGNIPDTMRIIVMDNSGGGIFRFIKSTSGLPQDILDKYFCLSGLPEAAAIAGAYGIETLEAGNMEQLKEAVAWMADDSDLPRMLIVRTSPADSSKILKSYFFR